MPVRGNLGIFTIRFANGTGATRLRSVQVITGSRLHFGLTRFWSDPHARFTGVGVMIEDPPTVVTVSGSTSETLSNGKRAAEFARRWLAHIGRGDMEIPGLRVACPPAHAGLGSGTQLAQAVAAGLNVFLGKEPPDVREVARALCRGQRSMTGSGGFAAGGLIAGRGTVNLTGMTTDIIGEFDHTPVPADWRVLLIRDGQGARIFGDDERAAFDGLRARDEKRATHLEMLIRDEILPAAASGNFARFTGAVQEYGLLSGEYFHEVQGGPYNGEVIASLVGRLQGLQANGTGQSSWGPTVYCWCRNQFEANEFAQRIADTIEPRFKMAITRVRNTPATIVLADTGTLEKVPPTDHVA